MLIVKAGESERSLGSGSGSGVDSPLRKILSCIFLTADAMVDEGGQERAGKGLK